MYPKGLYNVNPPTELQWLPLNILYVYITSRYVTVTSVDLEHPAQEYQKRKSSRKNNSSHINKI